jgi:hypothetical protein
MNQVVQRQPGNTRRPWVDPRALAQQQRTAERADVPAALSRDRLGRWLPRQPEPQGAKADPTGRVVPWQPSSASQDWQAEAEGPQGSIRTLK